MVIRLPLQLSKLWWVDGIWLRSEMIPCVRLVCSTGRLSVSSLHIHHRRTSCVFALSTGRDFLTALSPPNVTLVVNPACSCRVTALAELLVLRARCPLCRRRRRWLAAATKGGEAFGITGAGGAASSKEAVGALGDHHSGVFVLCTVGRGSGGGGRGGARDLSVALARIVRLISVEATVWVGG